MTSRLNVILSGAKNLSQRVALWLHQIESLPNSGSVISHDFSTLLSLLDELSNGLVNRDRVANEIVMSLAGQNHELRLRDFAS
jgi:hypothetical protein